MSEFEVVPRTAELERLIAAPPERAGDFPPDHATLFARTHVPTRPLPNGVARVVLAHRLREARVQTGFTRFEARTPDLQGDYPEESLGVKVAPLATDPRWLPGIEIFARCSSCSWTSRPCARGKIERRCERASTHCSRAMTRKQKPWHAAAGKRRPFTGGASNAHVSLGLPALKLLFAFLHRFSLQAPDRVLEGNGESSIDPWHRPESASESLDLEAHHLARRAEDLQELNPIYKAQVRNEILPARLIILEKGNLGEKPLPESYRPPRREGA